MGSLVSSIYIILLASLFILLFGFSSVLGQDLREQDALCNADGCFVVYFQRKTFLESWRACKEKGGNLATIKRQQDAASISTLFSAVDLRSSNAEVRVWIGLQRQPRQCAANRPLRGFSWTTGDQDTEYTNWMKEDSLNMCSVPRCVVMGYSTKEQNENFKWLDGSCSVPVDGYLCHYTYKGMCHALRVEGAGNALYTTPFNLVTTQQRYLPFGSVATMPCPSGAKEEQSVLCMLKEGGFMGWSREQPLCSEPSVADNWCHQNNGGCEHYCRTAGDHTYCECADGYQLEDDGQSCELSDVCQGSPCQFECVPLSNSYRCACPEGYMLAPNERNCIDVDECLQSPCEQLCENLQGTFECRCRDGYHLDTMGGCEDIDECIDDPCEHACENTPGSHVCHCDLGFSSVPEEPSRCQDIDECQIPGTCEQMCVNYDGGFECYCEEGFALRSDQYSCQKRAEGDNQAAVTHQVGLVWEPANYDWNAEQSHTEWPTEEEQSLDWLTDLPRVLNSDVIWVTSAPQEELPTDSVLGPMIPGDKEDEGGIGAELLEWGQSSQSEPNILSSTNTMSPPTSYGTTPDWYGDKEEEEATTTVPFLSTSTISEGAWNWWVEVATSSLNRGNPEDLVTDRNTLTDSSNYSTQKEEQDLLRENSQYPEDELGGEEEDLVEIIHSQGLTVPTQFTTSQPPLSKGGGSGDIPESAEEDRSSTWLLVGLLVPICIFIVVMVALGIVYCTRCAVQQRNKNATDCYHWISGAHDKQGAPNPSAGVKTHV